MSRHAITKILAARFHALALAVASAIVTIAVLFTAGPAEAGDKGGSDSGRLVLEKQIRHNCKNLVGDWLRSEGLRDISIQDKSSRCFVSHARVVIMGGRDWDLDLSKTTIRTLPAEILRSRTGFNFDWYSRLAGRSFVSPPIGSVRVLKEPTITTGTAGGEVQ